MDNPNQFFVFREQSRYEKLCPICELWLVEVQMIDGEGSFHCVRCETTDVFLPVNSEL